MKITKTQLKQIIKEELDNTLKEAASPDSPGLLRAIWDMLKGEFDEDYHGSYEPENLEVRKKTPEEKEEEQEEEEARSMGAGPRATSHRDAYYRGGTYDPTLEGRRRKITKTQLKRIIKEEFGTVLNEQYGVSYEVDVENSRFDMDPDAIPMPAQSEVAKVVENRLLKDAPAMGAPFVIDFNHMVMYLQKDLGMPDTSDHGYMMTDESKTAAIRALRRYVENTFGPMADVAGVPDSRGVAREKTVPLGDYHMRYGRGVSMFNLRDTSKPGFGLTGPYFDYMSDVADKRKEAAMGRRFPLS